MKNVAQLASILSFKVKMEIRQNITLKSLWPLQKNVIFVADIFNLELRILMINLAINH